MLVWNKKFVSILNGHISGRSPVAIDAVVDYKFLTVVCYFPYWIGPFYDGQEASSLIMFQYSVYSAGDALPVQKEVLRPKDSVELYVLNQQ
ncbi:hypothetical protein Bpfe_023839, partial [Biomphalaria pfeifferi]